MRLQQKSRRGKKPKNVFSGHGMLSLYFVKNKLMCLWSSNRTVCFLCTCNAVFWYSSLFGVRNMSLKILPPQHVLFQAVYHFPQLINLLETMWLWTLPRNFIGMILTCWTCLPLFLLPTVPAVLKLFQSCPWESTDDLKQLSKLNS